MLVWGAGMYWNRWYSVRGYVQSSLWIVPFISLLIYAVAIRLIYAIEGWTVWRDFPQFVGLATVGNTKRSRNDRHNDADVYRVHLWLASCGRSDCRRTIDAADHGGHSSARQRDPICSWSFHLHSSVCDRSIGQVGDNGSPCCRVRCGTPWSLLPCHLSFSDRLRRTASDPGPHHLARRRRKGARSSRASTATGLPTRSSLKVRTGKSDAGPDCTAPRQTRDPPGGEFQSSGRGGTEGKRHHRTGATSR